MKIQVQEGNYGGKLQVQDLSKVAVFADIERMLTPDFLYEHIQQYLKDLMQEINKPVVECQHCNGLGCITKTIGTNERGG